mgnify:CR=1 FL=1
MPELNKIDRKLEERSHLAIEFPQTDNRVFRTYLPFLENPKVTEKGSANLAEYNLLGRPGSIFSYGGSPSREISVTFKISLLNLLHLESTEGLSERFTRSFNLFFSDKEMAKKRFNLTAETVLDGPAISSFAGPSPLVAGPEKVEEFVTKTDAQLQDENVGSADVKMGKGTEHASIHRAYYRSLVGRVTGDQPIFDGIANFLVGGINAIPSFFDSPDGTRLGSPQQNEEKLNRTLDMIYVWVNLIRSTTLNNSTNTVLGPPIVRLTHGAMYNNVPCVVEDYSIKIIDDSGFEIQSLTPKQLEVTLSMRENRTGNQGTFDSGSIGSGDKIVGWEAIIDDNNLDPYNGLINRDKEYLN